MGDRRIRLGLGAWAAPVKGGRGLCRGWAAFDLKGRKNLVEEDLCGIGAGLDET